MEPEANQKRTGEVLASVYNLHNFLWEGFLELHANRKGYKKYPGIFFLMLHAYLEEANLKKRV